MYYVFEIGLRTSLLYIYTFINIIQLEKIRWIFSWQFAIYALNDQLYIFSL